MPYSVSWLVWVRTEFHGGKSDTHQPSKSLLFLEEFIMLLGHVIREIRQAKGLSLADLASRTQTTKSYLSKIETDKRDPSINTISAICGALNVPLSILILLAENPENDEFSEITKILQGLARDSILESERV